MKKYTQADFLKTLFDDGDHLVLAKNKYGITSYKFDPSKQSRCQYFGLNPLKEGTTRAILNCVEYRTFLIEFDQKDAKGRPIPPRQQLSYFNEVFGKGMLTAAVYSGSKSSHIFIRLNNPVDLAEYKRIHWRICSALAFSDEQVSDPGRLARLGGAIRPDTEKEQEILFLGDKVELSKLERRLDRLGIAKEEPKKYRKTSTAKFTGTPRLPKADLDILSGKEVIPEGGRYNTFRAIIARIVARKVDMDEESIYNRLTTARELCGFIEPEDDEMIIKSIEGALNKFS